VRRGLRDQKEKEIHLRKAIALVDDGVNKHSHNNEVRQLLADLKKELLSLAVVRRRD
jgi:hypothetical protein